MNKTLKTTIAGILLAGSLASGAAFAEYNHDGSVNIQGDIMTISETVEAEAIQDAAFSPMTKPIYRIFVNNEMLDADTYVDGEHVMLPLRAICEALGYAVDYNNETTMISLTRDAQYITMYPTKDEYTFSKMAPAKLGIAPQLVDDRTYVPVSFVEEILQSAGCTVDQNGEIRITDPKEEENNYKLVTATEEVKDGIVLVMDEILGEVEVTFAEETIFQGISASDITTGTEFMVEYVDNAVTMSLPAQAVAKTVMSVELYEEVYLPAEVAGVSYEGTITEVGEDFVVVETENGEIRLNVSEETNIHHVMNRRLYRINDLEAGMKISGTHAEAATFSLPPQSAAIEIVIEG
ncbi:MAG: copper amine oxidase N-terminal domain-containing protein [Clostridia bacterium]|nr:copper amine oxidase N-terminal domain-containing protein [Clostridia bacterium]